MTQTLPEIGQLVDVRRRQWVVTDLHQATMPRATGLGPQHLVTLASIDEDTPNETLDAIWQLEPGAKVIERAGLPVINGFDSADRLDAFLDAVRWGATTQADRSLLQAPFRSGVEIEDFQLEPLVRAIDMARVNLLIADDVGLGKTIEAGLVVQELIIRHRARTVFVLCPSSLQTKWKDELREKFGLEFQIVDTDYVKRLRRERGLHANPWTSYPRLISSIDWAKAGEGRRLLKDALPPHVTYPRKFDVLLVDEAHNVAPANSGKYAEPSQRTHLIRTIAKHFEHRMFLSATPHNGYQDSFTALLELLDDQRFARGVEPKADALQRVLVRRLKDDILDKDGNKVFAARKIEMLKVPYSEEERAIHQLLKDYTESRTSNDDGKKAAVGTAFIHKLLKKRLFSSPAAFATTLGKHQESLKPGRKKKTNKKFAERILRKAIQQAQEDYADDRQLEASQDEAIEAATVLESPLSAEQQKMLDKMSNWVEQNKHRGDAKADAILRWLDDHLKTDGKPNEKRVILFTEYRATHSWLLQVLVASGWGGELLSEITGDTDGDDRDQIKAAFQADPADAPVRILLATDAASEGIDLQNHCNYLIHVEIPWNPNVMEQRNGRIDRHGQKQNEVLIWHPVGSRTAEEGGELDGDHEFLMRAVEKVQAIREDLGSVGPVIEQQIEEAMLGDREKLDTSVAEKRAQKSRKYVSADRKLVERTVKLHDKLIEARDTTKMTPDRVARAVQMALGLAGKPPLEPVDQNGNRHLYAVPALTGSWDQATIGLAHPHTGAIRPITFDHAIAAKRDDVVLAHMQHRLVQMSMRLLRAEIWAHEDTRKLHRVEVKQVPDGVIDSPVAITVARLVITGKSQQRLHEELTRSGGTIGGGKFSRMRKLGDIENLFKQSQPYLPSDKLFEELKSLFKKNEKGIQTAYEARSRERLEGLVNTLNREMKKKQEDLTKLLADLEVMIQDELADTEKYKQLVLGYEEKTAREVLHRDREALEARLAAIPEEREEELKNIARHYADPVERTFPVAVVFFVPASMTE